MVLTCILSVFVACLLSWFFDFVFLQHTFCYHTIILLLYLLWIFEYVWKKLKSWREWRVHGLVAISLLATVSNTATARIRHLATSPSDQAGCQPKARQPGT